MIIYAAQYCPCIHESAWGIISLHKTRKGAEIALEFHKNEQRKDYDEYYRNIVEDFPNFLYDFGRDERWDITEIELEE